MKIKTPNLSKTPSWAKAQTARSAWLAMRKGAASDAQKKKARDAYRSLMARCAGESGIFRQFK